MKLSCLDRVFLNLNLGYKQEVKFIPIAHTHTRTKKIIFEISKYCRLCEEEEETFIHLISECPRLEITRREIFLDRVMGYDHSWSIRRVMRFIQYPVIMQMLTHKDGALLKDLVEIDHNYSITSESDPNTSGAVQ